ncbi:MAG: serine protease, partial [Actinomycetota bacterium]
MPTHHTTKSNRPTLSDDAGSSGNNDRPAVHPGPTAPTALAAPGDAFPAPDPATAATRSAARVQAVGTPGPQPGIHRRRLVAIAAGASLVTGGLVAATGGPAGAIIDGEAASAGDNPWQVALTSDGEQFCGGSLVSDRVVVTAAHCVVGTDAADIQITAGATDLADDPAQTVQVAGVVEHPSYDGGSADIAMLVLERPVDLGDDAAAVPIATAAEASAADTARVTGWGARGEDDEGTSTLQTADVPIVDDDSCDAALGGGIDPENELCAGGTGTDTCFGDSGGPLTVDSDRGRVLAGVTSWGIECGGATPGVYAEVPTFADWIAERVDDPDALLPERLDTADFDLDGHVGDGDELPDGLEIGDDEVHADMVEIPDEFFEEYGEQIDDLDEQFWDLFEEWSERQDNDSEEANADDTDDADPDTGTDDTDDTDDADDADPDTGTDDPGQ